MKNNKQDFLDREPWYKNHPSPFAKWMSNFSMLGAQYFKNKNLAILWFILFNPAMQILYIVFLFVFLWFTYKHYQC